tara:strand:+ start:4278 stop:4925 length:648 start_codon:yes stop_codon:yes gene_type:complete
MSSIKLKHSGGNAVSLHPPTSAPSSSDVQFKLPTADGSAGQFMKTDGSGNLAFAAVSGGITEVDQYRLSSNITNSGNNATIDAWERTDTSIHAANASPHGTGMSYSSGIFTFPSTGKYLVILNMKCSCGVDDNVQIYHQVTTDNSSYTAIAGSTDGQNGGSGVRNGSGTSFCFIDVTNTTNVKIRFYADSIGSNSFLQGGSNESTEVIFIRIADT